MKTFKNKNFKKRDPECTNVVFCKAATAPSPDWIECLPEELTGCDRLYTQSGIPESQGITFYGYL